ESFLQALALTLVAVTVLLAIILRRVRDVVLTLLPLVASAVALLALSVVLDRPFDFANVIVLPLLFGLGVASSLHVVSRSRELGRGGALLRSSTPRAVLFSALTTVASFGSLILSSH